MIVADTSVWIDYLNGIDAPHTAALDRELGRRRVLTGDIIIAELLRGYRSESEYLRAKYIMDCLEYRDFLGKEIAIRSASNYRALRRRGITVRSTINVIIATYCIEHGIPLMHHDRDFDVMEQELGLLVVR